MITNRAEAVAFLDERIGRGIRPGTERIEGLLELMTAPHLSYPSIHVAGTNGKTTTVWMTEKLFEEHGLRVGSYTSPHLQQIEDRFRIAGRRFTGVDFAAATADVAPFIEIYEDRSATSVTYFEATVAIAFQAFAAAGVDVAVVEVGLGGRLDATNVLASSVSIITGISLDHTTVLGDSLGAIAAEKAAIVPNGGRLVTGPLPAAAEGAVTARVADTGAAWFRSGSDFAVTDASRAVGGWSASIEGLYGSYDEVFLGLHGRHQVDHFATSIVATEMFLDGELDHEAVMRAAATVAAPGRIEIIDRRPLVIVDGSHNAEGVEGLAGALREEFPEADRVLVVGIRGQREPAELLRPLRGLVSRVIATEAVDGHAVAADDVAAAARIELGDIPVEVAAPVAQAVTEALHLAGESGIVVVAGSLYVAGEARTRLLGG